MDRPRIGLALGSGGARGFAHLGVLKVLVEENIPIDYIAGSSMGALIGTFYGVGHSIESMYKLSTAFKRKYFLDFTVPKMGFISGKRLKEFIHLFSHQKRLEDLHPPVAVVATDLMRAEKIVFTQGSIADAVRASISIPGIFVPEKINGKLLVDGGVIDRVPVSVVREMGANIVIGVDVAHVKQNEEITNIYDVIMQSIDIMQMELVESREIASDVMIRPRVEQFSSRAFKNTEEIIAIGEEETRRMISTIRQVIQQWKE
ncbi:patatin-like phospholipase family protein [Aeribacillus pallidus]|uniref:patatin-like phospholipase family protein n=1 Tax=Aeribacillus pallidus TaxID=33936 RepID=UPI003D226BF9